MKLYDTLQLQELIFLLRCRIEGKMLKLLDEARNRQTLFVRGSKRRTF